MWAQSLLKDKWKLILIGFLACCTFWGYSWYSQKNDISYVIRSDGSGYYAYLPSVFIYNDPTFLKAQASEANYHNGEVSRNYIFKTKDGAHYNKYFPGLAILQIPFFLLACLFAKLFGSPVDGYSAIFQVFFWISSLFYCYAGILLWWRILKSFFQLSAKTIVPFILLIALASPIVFYSFKTPSFTHVYSFFLIAVFINLLIKLKEATTTKRLFLLGITLGLIFLLRPTNLVVILAVPLIWTSWNAFMNWFKALFTVHLQKTFVFFIMFLGVVSMLFFAWKWQTGNWIVWSYSGEGFDFLHTPFISGLFSFRMGLFLHTPVLLLAILGWFFWFKENRFQAIWWAVYAIINAWIIFSWWCWDYESSFGNRPFTEHMILLTFPIILFIKKHKKLALTGLVVFALLGTIRLYTFTTNQMVYQRFTKDNYLSSLRFWDKQNEGRWYFTRACEPHGNVVGSWDLLNQKEEIIFQPSDEFKLTAEFKIPQHRKGERYFIRAKLDKQLLNNQPFEQVFLVIDAHKEGLSHRYYKAIDLYNDKLEGKNSWKSLIFETQVYDFLEEYDQVSVYIWNSGKQHFKLKNIHYRLEAYR